MALAALALALLLGVQDAPVKVTDAGVTQPRILRKIEPQYSKRARKKKIEGDVTLRIIVAPDGIARDIKVEKSLDKDLDANAITAVEHWVFQPATKDGKPVACYAKIILTYHLIHR